MTRKLILDVDAYDDDDLDFADGSDIDDDELDGFLNGGPINF